MESYDHLVKYFSSFAYFVPRHQVNPYFIHALILAESSANPRAISPEKAYGLGQIILSTARIAGRELADSGIEFKYIRESRLKNLRRNDLFNPAINILLTCYLIAKYNYKFNGQLELVITAWNAGEYSKYLYHGKHAPYKETENLIGKVNGYYNYLLKNR
ncbi:lytic transglycosylase domain-containing protein [Desulfotalea psychrophila]|nr:lytic transglycosylase domain-containing protein [Desulfotalea psychrophila]